MKVLGCLTSSLKGGMLILPLCRLCSRSNTTCATIGVETTCPLGVLEIGPVLSGVRVFDIFNNYMFINFSYVLQCSFLFRVYMLTRYSIRLYSDLGAHVLIVLFVFIYVYRSQTWFPYQTYVSYTIAMIGATRWTGTAYWSETHTFTPVVLWSWYYIRLPRCLVEFVLHTFTPVV
jgi:hypothetical protein